MIYDFWDPWEPLFVNFNIPNHVKQAKKSPSPFLANRFLGHLDFGELLFLDCGKLGILKSWKLETWKLGNIETLKL